MNLSDFDHLRDAGRLGEPRPAPDPERDRLAARLRQHTAARHALDTLAAVLDEIEVRTGPDAETTAGVLLGPALANVRRYLDTSEAETTLVFASLPARFIVPVIPEEAGP